MIDEIHDWCGIDDMLGDRYIEETYFGYSVYSPQNGSRIEFSTYDELIEYLKGEQ